MAPSVTARDEDAGDSRFFFGEAAEASDEKMDDGYQGTLLFFVIRYPDRSNQLWMDRTKKRFLFSTRLLVSTVPVYIMSSSTAAPCPSALL
jgi:hypothetical protein